MKKQILLHLLLLHVLVSHAQVMTLQGKVIDSLTQKGIPYVNIGFPKLSIGTSANEEGAFVLKVSEAYRNDTLVISSMGYASYKVVFKNIENKENCKVVLKTNDVKLDEFTVKSLDAKKIVKKILQRLFDNYATEPAMMQVFCREIVKEKDTEQYFSYSEGIMEMYKSSVKRNDDHVRLIKGRKKNLPNAFMRDNKSYPLTEVVNGPAAAIILDIVKSKEFFLSNLDQFKFRHESYSIIDDRVTYVIYFEPKDSSKRELLPQDIDFVQGKMYVDTATYTLIRSEFETSVRGLRVYNMEFEKDLVPIKLKKRNYTINYTQSNGKWYFKSGNVLNHYAYKNDLIELTHKLECLVTQIKTDHVKKFNSNEDISNEASFNKKIKQFDDSFWEDYNFIKATSDSEGTIKQTKNKSDTTALVSTIEKDETSNVKPVVIPKRVKTDRVTFLDGSLDKAKKLAASQKKFIFVDVYADWCMPCKQMASEVFYKREIAEKMNTFFINVKIDADRDDNSVFTRYGIEGLPTTLILDSTGAVVFRNMGYSGVSTFDAQINNVIKLLPKGGLFLASKDLLEKENSNYDNWMRYAILRKSLGIPNDQLIDALITKLPEDTLKQPFFQQLLTTYASELDSKTFSFLLSHRETPIYERKLKKLITQNLDWAIEEEDKTLLENVIKANALIISDSATKQAEKERLQNLYKEKVKQKKEAKK
jgi:thiol-disulfide isomerase/thioredoxin